MKVLVASALEAGSLRAYAINTVKIAEGFAKLGHDVTLVCHAPKAGRQSKEDLQTLYGLQAPIQWVQLPQRFLGMTVTNGWFFALMALPSLFRVSPDRVYSRSYVFPTLTSRLGVPTLAETHAWPENDNPAFQSMINATRNKTFQYCITISHRLAEQYIMKGALPEKVLVLPDAVDLHMFSRPSNRQSSDSPYSTDRPNVAYVGHLFDYKGIPTILEAAKLLPEVNFHLVGGLPLDIKRHTKTVAEQGLTNVMLHGLQPFGQVPAYLWHADILLLPPSANHPSAAWTSPLKLGEYLASGTPAIVTAIPALKDWVDDNEVCFVPPDDAESMAQAIRLILSDGALAQRLSQNGLQKALTFSYERRVAAMLNEPFPETLRDPSFTAVQDQSLETVAP
jgi:glycosyltransferase involved in cell wall biosynthesis